MRSEEEIKQAIENSRRKWEDSGNPYFAIAEGTLAWILGENKFAGLQIIFEEENARSSL